jgi:hypothetical protein
MANSSVSLNRSPALALQVLRVTAGNIRSLGPAGALEACSPYAIWLAEVERAIAALEQEAR